MGNGLCTVIININVYNSYEKKKFQAFPFSLSKTCSSNSNNLAQPHAEDLIQGKIIFILTCWLISLN